MINNPIDIQKIDKDSFKKVSDVQLPENYVTFIGRMTPVKNLYFLIDSFELFWVRHCDYFLLMIGEGYQRNELEEYLSRKKCANNVLFIGAQENPYSFLNDAKLLLLTSYSEAYPTVLIEAMSLGVTCVCTPTLGAKDILEEGKYGYIINTFDDKMEYFQAMESALSNPLEKKMLRNLVEQKYSLDKKINDFLNFVNS